VLKQLLLAPVKVNTAAMFMYKAFGHIPIATVHIFTAPMSIYLIINNINIVAENTAIAAV
jgi:hypothetical protein